MKAARFSHGVHLGDEKQPIPPNFRSPGIPAPGAIPRIAVRQAQARQPTRDRGNPGPAGSQANPQKLLLQLPLGRDRSLMVRSSRPRILAGRQRR